MAANYTATNGHGSEKDSVVFTNGGSSTPAVTIIVNTTKITTQSQAYRTIRTIAEKILEKNHPAA